MNKKNGKIIFDNKGKKLETEIINGECKLQLNCPNNYKHKKVTFPRYVNYTYLTKDKIWNPNINILTILCYIKYKKFSKIVENKDTIILYSNDNKDDKKLIHNSYSISNKSLSEIDNKEDFIMAKVFLDLRMKKIELD